MKKILIFLISLFLFAQAEPLYNSKGLIDTSFEQKDFPISGVHQKLQLDCKNCHLEKSPQDFSSATQQSCLSCHGSYAKLSEATGGLGHNDNIHANPHYEALDCDTCHKAHQPTVNMCVRCHTQESLKSLLVK